MRIDSLHPDTELVLQIGKTEKRVATFIGIQGTKDERIAMFASSDEDGSYRWTAFRAAGYWRTGPLADSVKIGSIIRDPRFPEPEAPAETDIQYGYQADNSTAITWHPCKEDAELVKKVYGGRVVYRTVTYGEVQTDN